MLSTCVRLITVRQSLLEWPEGITTIAANSRKDDVPIQSHSIFDSAVTVWQDQLRMVKRSSAVLHSLVGQMLHEFDQIELRGFIALQFRNATDIRVKILNVGFLEVDHFQQVPGTTVVEIRTSQFDVSQSRCLEGTVHGNPSTGRNIDLTDVATILTLL